MNTLAFGYILPTTGRIPDFHRLETCAAGRTNKDAGCNGQRAAVSGVCLFFIYGLCTFRHFYDFFIPRLPVLCVQNTNSFMMDDVPLADPMTHKFYNHHLPDNTNILLQNIQLVQVQGLNFQRTAI